MFRSCYVRVIRAASVAAVVVASAAQCMALGVISPTPDQIVRERVKIIIPASAIPQGGFASVFVGPKDSQVFVTATKPAQISKSSPNVITYWDTKSPYKESSNQKQDKFFKDGRYPLRIQVHDGMGRMVDSSEIMVNLKNKIDRPNPAPAVKLVNTLNYGQTLKYRVRANVQIFDKVGLPIMGGLGMTGDFLILQSLEDIRTNGELLVRYRIGDNPFVTVAGNKQFLYTEQAIKPQLYRLLNKYGSVIKSNMFTKQQKFSIMDIMPKLPAKQVKEGDAWPDSMTVKIEGLTRLSEFKGNAMLDSFEWQGGKKCAKIISNLTGISAISLAGGRIYSTGAPVSAVVTSYFAYDSGKLLRREIVMDFPAIIEPDAEDFTQEDLMADEAKMGMEESAMPGEAPVPTQVMPDEKKPGGTTTVFKKGDAYGGPGSSGANPEDQLQRGTVQLNVAIQLEN